MVCLEGDQQVCVLIRCRNFDQLHDVVLAQVADVEDPTVYMAVSVVLNWVLCQGDGRLAIDGDRCWSGHYASDFSD